MFVMKYLATKLNNEEYEKFVEKCNSCGESRAEHLRNMVASYLTGENISSKEVIEKEDGTYILPAGSIMHSDGGVSCPDGSMIINFDDDEVKRIEECAGHKCQSNKELSDAIMRIAMEVEKR